MFRAVLPGEAGEVHQLDPFRRIGPTVVVPTPAWFGEVNSDSARSRSPAPVLWSSVAGLGEHLSSAVVASGSDPGGGVAEVEAGPVVGVHRQ